MPALHPPPSLRPVPIPSPLLRVPLLRPVCFRFFPVPVCSQILSFDHPTVFTSCPSPAPPSLPPMISSHNPPPRHPLRTNEHLAVLLPKHLWKVRKRTASIAVMDTDLRLTQADSMASRCDNFFCHVRFSLFERRHVCRGPLFLRMHPHRHSVSSIVESAVASFAADALPGPQPCLTFPTLTSCTHHGTSLFLYTTPHALQSSLAVFAMIVGSRFMVVPVLGPLSSFTLLLSLFAQNPSPKPLPSPPPLPLRQTYWVLPSVALFVQREACPVWAAPLDALAVASSSFQKRLSKPKSFHHSPHLVNSMRIH